MVGAQHPLAVGEGPLEQRDRLGRPPRRLVGGGEVCGGQGVGVVGAQHRSRSASVRSYSGIASAGPPGSLVGGGEVVAGGQGVGVVGAQDPLAVGQGPLVQRDRLGRSARPPGRRARLFGRSACRGGRRPAPARVGQGPLVQRDRLGVRPPPGRRGEVLRRAQGVGVVGAQDPLAVGQGALVQRDRLGIRPPPGRRGRGCSGRSGCRGGRRPGPARGRRGSARTAGSPRRPPGRLVGGGEVVAARSACRGGRRPGPARGRRGCARTAGSPRRSARPPGRRWRGCCGRSGCRGGRRPGPARGRRGCVRTAGSPRRSARRLVGEARLFRDVRVSGWSAPRTRSRSASVRSYSGIASAGPPGSPVGVGEVDARGQGVGVVGAQQPLAVGDQRIAELDSLAGAIAEVVQAPAAPSAQFQQDVGQLASVAVKAGGQVLMQRGDLPGPHPGPPAGYATARPLTARGASSSAAPSRHDPQPGAPPGPAVPGPPASPAGVR